MRNRPIRFLAVLAVFGLLAACSDDDSDSADSTTTVAEAMDQSSTTAAGMDEGTDETTAESTDDTSSEPASEGDIVDTAIAAGDFETLVTAVQSAGLEDTLRGEGPFTVFAPTDDAFAALPEGTLDSLLADPEGALAPILTYHVISGEVMAADVLGMDGQTVTTVNGASLTINVDGEKVSLTDATGNTVNVIATDVAADNGVIHVIDGVLMPG